MKPLIKIIDTQFAHGTSLGSGDLKIFPKYFDWYRGNDKVGDVIIFTESSFHLVDNYTENIKIAWLIEPVSINPASYAWITRSENYSKFTHIFTYNRKILSCDPRFRYYHFGGCWILPEDRKIYPKENKISIIASAKDMTYGHKMRHAVINRFKDRVEVYGRGYVPVDYKLSALANFKYSIVIENDQTPGFYSEKLVDCLITGTIPIFWGADDIEETFNIGGMRLFKTLDDLERVLNSIDKYGDSIVAKEIVEDNFETAKKYCCPEDSLWERFLHKLF